MSGQEDRVPGHRIFTDQFGGSLDETPAPCGPVLDEPARAKHHGRCKGRAYTECDRRAFEKRVAKRRAKKGYA